MISSPVPLTSSPDWARDFGFDVAAGKADILEHSVVQRLKGPALTVDIDAVEREGDDATAK
jgi:hypothetical protein